MASRLVAATLAGCVFLAGCMGSDPPELEDLDGAASRGQLDGVAEVVMIFPPVRTPEHAIWGAVASAKIGEAKLVYSVEHPEPDDPPQRQAELVRAAVDRGAAALIVVPGDPEVLAPALAEARARGVKLLTLGAVVPVPDGPPVPAVVQTPPEVSAAELVEVALAAAGAEEPPLEGPAVLLVPESGEDPRVPLRIAGLKDSLQKAGITLLPDLPFQIEGNTPQKLLNAALSQEAGTRPALVFGLDDTAVTSATRVRGERFNDAPFILAGYVDNPDMIDLMRSGFCTAAVDGNLTAAAREAVRLTLDLLDGREVPERTEVPTPIRRATKRPNPSAFSLPGGPGGAPRDISGRNPFPPSK
jgi:ABC-type sugar transport system substrate-binding protein